MINKERLLTVGRKRNHTLGEFRTASSSIVVTTTKVIGVAFRKESHWWTFAWYR
jgi:hypothetical protein